ESPSRRAQTPARRSGRAGSADPSGTSRVLRSMRYVRTCSAPLLRSCGDFQLEAVLFGDGVEPLEVWRSIGRRWHLATLRGLSRLPEELVHAAGRVDHEQTHVLSVRGREVLLRSSRDVKDRSRSALMCRAGDVIANVALDDVDGLAAFVDMRRRAHSRCDGHHHRRELTARLVARCQDLVEPVEHPERLALARPAHDSRAGHMPSLRLPTILVWRPSRPPTVFPQAREVKVSRKT